MSALAEPDVTEWFLVSTTQADFDRLAGEYATEGYETTRAITTTGKPGLYRAIRRPLPDCQACGGERHLNGSCSQCGNREA